MASVHLLRGELQNLSDHIPAGKAYIISGFIRSFTLIVAFFVHLAQIAEFVTPRDFTVVFYVLISSFCFAKILASGWEGEMRKLSEDSSSNVTYDLDKIYSGATVTALIGIFAWILVATFYPPAVLAETPFGFVAIVILTAIFTSINVLAATSLKSNLYGLVTSNVFIVFVMASFLVTSAISKFWTLEASLVLGCHILLASAALFLTLALRTKPKIANQKSVWIDHNFILVKMGQQALRYIDIILAGWLLSGHFLSTYLTLRIGVFLVDFVFAALKKATFVPLSTLYDTASTRDFRATAARVNLSFLLIGGSCTIAVMQVGPFSFDYLRLEDILSHQVLAWLVFARGAPLIFGANEIFLGVSQHQKVAALLSWSFATVLVVLMCSAGRVDGLMFAKTYAITLVAYNFASAAYVARYLSVWPGITAVFHGQLKLL